MAQVQRSQVSGTLTNSRQSAEKAEVTESRPPDEENWVKTLRNEIDSYFELMKKFNSRTPSEVLQDLSSIISRAAEIRIKLSRSNHKLAQAIRTKEVDTLLDAADKLFKIHSRLIALQESERQATRGQF